jgi:SAM-dependent methyltransferase
MSNSLRRMFSWLYPVQLEKVRGELNHELEVNMHNGRLLLDSANVNYSFGSLQQVFDNAFEQTGLYDEALDTALILGFGSGSVAELLLEKCDPDMKLTGVEADLEVIRLAKQYFPIAKHNNVSIVHADAASFIYENKHTFDLIIVDVFIEDIVPASVQNVEFLRRVKSHLKKGGRLYFNKMRVKDDIISMDDFEKNLKVVFRHLKMIRMNLGGGSNCIFVATT